MKVVTTALAFSLIAGSAASIERYQTMRMSCNEVQDAIDYDGAAILRWQSKTTGLPRYDRYVRDTDFCNVGEVARFARVPTRDDSACIVYKCEQVDPFDDRRILIPR